MTSVTPEEFPFKLEDLKYWVIRREDGTITKFNIVGKADNKPIIAQPGVTHPYGSGTTTPVKVDDDWKNFGYHKFCNHSPRPSLDPIMEEGDVRLYVADAIGLRTNFRLFDFVLDCGDVLSNTIIHDWKAATLVGDPYMVEKFRGFSKFVEPIILQVDWYDRQAPPLDFGFFPDYAGEVKGNVVTACQGGHGRSGSSAVMIMMSLIPDYTPYDAICHLRALHCPRAIESKEQHAYIGEFGAFLGRENNVDKVAEVKNFKTAFLALKVKGAEKYQKFLLAKDEGETKA